MHAARQDGFTLIELLISMGIIAVLATAVFVAIGPSRQNARDTARETQINTIGRFLASSSCYAPDGGAGDYDLKVIYDEIVSKNEEIKRFLTSVPKDPRIGSDDVSGFRYAYAADGHCALYANLENADAVLTLPDLDAPTPGGGTGILKAASPGPNGTGKYYQISK